jgi:hypothetical protein
MTRRDLMNTALEQALARKRAEALARIQALDPAQLAADEARWAERSARAARAKEAQRSGQRTPRPRDQNPAPRPTRLWAKSLSCAAMGDTCLTMGARAALVLIRALTALGERISKAGLAKLLGVAPRTVQRYLAVLRERGYIRTRLIANALGWIVAQAVEITDTVLPPHERPARPSLLAAIAPQRRRIQGETGTPGPADP